jgi:hypothetical protein
MIPPLGQGYASGATNIKGRIAIAVPVAADIKERIAIMASLFVKEKLVDPYIIAIDSTLLRAKGHRFFCKKGSSIMSSMVPFCH